LLRLIYLILKSSKFIVWCFLRTSGGRDARPTYHNEGCF
jgi:hypothetical protein